MQPLPTALLTPPGVMPKSSWIEAMARNGVKEVMMAYTSEDDPQTPEAWQKALREAGLGLTLFASSFVSLPSFVPCVRVTTPSFEDAALRRAYERFTVQKRMFARAVGVFAVWNGINTHRIGSMADAMRVAVRRGLMLHVLTYSPHLKARDSGFRARLARDSGSYSLYAKGRCPDLLKDCTKNIRKFSRKINSLSNFLLPYIPMPKGKGFTARSGKLTTTPKKSKNRDKE